MIITLGAWKTSEQFHHLRNQVWLEALGPEPHGTLAEMQKRMPGWPVLLTFHLFTAAALNALPAGGAMIYRARNEAAAWSVWLDAWEARRC